ncbi:MAG TPA: hypothetical protein VMV49_17235 [Candidatus Deferrimicrobium sp.]|nr:hypothetical protein [Candidatus Deferrimicrobium sp.]
MGRTIPSFRLALEQEIVQWQHFRKALRPKDRAIFDKLLDKARIHGDAGMLANRPVIMDTAFMAVLLEQQKEIDHLQQQIEQLKYKLV